MRILFVTTFYPPFNLGGDGIAVQRMARALARDGHEVEVIHNVGAWALVRGEPAPSPLPDRDDSGVRIHPITGGSRLSLLVSHQTGAPTGPLKRVAEEIERNRPDLIHFHNVSLMGGPGILGSGRAVKFGTFHDYWFVCPMHVLWRFDREACSKRTCFRCTIHGRRPPQLWRGSRAANRLIRQVDAWIAPSRTARQLLLRNGFPAEIEVIPHFVPEIPGPGSSPHARSRPFFLFVGRLERLKGIDRLVRIFRRFDRAELHIAGDGSLRNEIRRDAELHDHIHLHGTVANSELRDLYRGAVALIAPSGCYETFGLSPLEAFACGTPAIVSGTGALKELAEDTGAAIVADDDDEIISAMDLLLEEPDRRDALGKLGLDATRREYNERRFLDRYRELFERAARSRKKK